jgi:HTH domain.
METNTFIETNKKGFTSIQNRIFYDTDINSTTKAVYCILCSACYGDKNTTYVSQNIIAQALNKSVRTVQRAIKTLKEHNYIAVKRRGSISNLMTIIGKNIHSKAQEIIDSMKGSKDKNNAPKGNKHTKNKPKSKQWAYESTGETYKDLDSLERKLLGWDKPQKDKFGEEYQQAILI